MPRTPPLILAALLAVTLAASGCGRKADLEKPSAMPAPNGEKKAPPVEDKPFILDGLIK